MLKYYFSLICLLFVGLVTYTTIKDSTIGKKEFVIEGNKLERANYIGLSFMDSYTYIKWNKKVVGWAQFKSYCQQQPAKQVGKNIWITYNTICGTRQVNHYYK